MTSLSDRLQDLRDHLARLTELAKASHGWTYDEEIATLDEVISILREAGA